MIHPSIRRSSLIEHYVALMRRGRIKRSRIWGFPRFLIVLLAVFIVYIVWILRLHAPLFSTKPIDEPISDSNSRDRDVAIREAPTIPIDEDFSITSSEIQTRAPWPPLQRSGCKNTVQGKSKVCDTNGAVCLRDDLDARGECCLQNEKTQADRYTCGGCDLTSRCCAEYEVCVSCCMSPNTTTLKRIYSAASENLLPVSIQNLRNLHPLHPATFSVFDYCEHACRHGSYSTHSENSYRGRHSFCFGPSKAPLETIPVNSDWFGFKRDNVP
jgi:hypothetical protein